ncbi:MAG: type I polyketide synthase [Paracoccaceae bacterium]|nr:type I polyketide synthase [Paracoccaceae bacterium]
MPGTRKIWGSISLRGITTKDSDQAAVIGYSARLPGADGISEVWQTLADGSCSVGLIPEDRWSSIRYFDPNREAPGKSYARHAGLLENVYAFDAGYFGLTPREAEQMDPQQRILLETVARAFDHSGIDPSALDKERTGVFIGAASSDHSTTCLQDPAMIDAQYMLGNTLSIISNRIAYQWDIQGPSYTVDTACSSGLFALDHARQAIETGAVDTAIVGSVNVLLSPMPFIGFSKASMLSPTGLCHAFGSGADGYVRAEGAVVFILRRAELASTSNDRIRSFLAATGTNSDGRTAGIAMPSSARQLSLLEQVKSQFGICPQDLAFVEAHGTGTLVGDPEEARAIGMAYGQQRDRSLPIGSAKTNFGHLEPAAGLVGLLKAQLALEHGVLPASLHAEELNPDIPFDELGLKVATSPMSLPHRDEPWLAAVNSFGFGGANAHAVLRQAELTHEPKATMPKALVLTAQSQTSLRCLAESWQKASQGADPEIAAMASDANTRLSRHRHRLCIPIKDNDLGAGLSAWLEDESPKSAIDGVARTKNDAKIGFVFSGNGSQWAGMGRYILLNDSVFRDTFSAANELAVWHGSQSLLEMIMSPDLDSRLDRAPVAQPLLMAIQIALVDALAAKGVRPAAAIGHSAGEVAAAYASGAISIEDAVRIIVARSTTLDRLYGTGTMAALVCDERTASDLIASTDLHINIAAENTPRSLTVSGATEDVAHLLKVCRKKRIVAKRLTIDYPYHSDLTDPLREQLLKQLEDIKGNPTKAPFYSGCRGEAIAGTALDTEFWWENARNKVRFREGIEAMAADGIQMFLEISPKSVLQSYIRDCLTESGHSGTVLGTLEQVNAEQIDTDSIAMTVLANGGSIDESALFGSHEQFVGDLPEYPFDRQEHRVSSDRQVDLFGSSEHHPLLGSRQSPDANIWSNELSVTRQPWLADHKVDSRIILPATAVLEMFLAAASEIGGTDSIEMRNFEILRPIQFELSETVPIRVVYDASGRRLSLEARNAGVWSWVAQAALFQLSKRTTDTISLSKGQENPALYPTLAQAGLDYGPSFARVDSVEVAGQIADVHLAPGALEDREFLLDPTSADAALHAVLLLLNSDLFDGRYLYVPARMGRVRLFASGPVVGARLTLRSHDLTGACIDVSYINSEGQILSSIEEIRLRPIPVSSKPHTAYWIEKQVPIKSGVKSPDGICIPLSSDEQPTDLEILRDSISGRLAWDIVERSSEKDIVDRRFDAAVAALEAMDLVSQPSDSTVLFNGECPWPDSSTLLNLLIETHPSATDDIEATLHGMVSDRRTDAPGYTRLVEAAINLIDMSHYAGQRILLCGHIDPSVVRHLVTDAGFLTIAVEREDDAEALSLNLDDANKCLITCFDDLKGRPEFDLIVTLAGAQVLPASRQKRLKTLCNEDAKLVFLDYTIDLFELMTGRYAGDEFLIDSSDFGKSEDPDIRREPLSGVPGVSALVVRGSVETPNNNVRASIIGEGSFSNSLRTFASDADTEEKSLSVVAFETSQDLASTLKSQARTLRALPDVSSTTWLVQKGLTGAAALRGWRRVLANETGRDLRTAIIHEDAEPESLLPLFANSSEHELTVLPDSVQSYRVLPLDTDVHRVPDGMKATLTQSTRGRLDTFEWTLSPLSVPTGDEVELAVESTALNFRDVMWAQGLLPGDLLEGGFAGPTLGMECSGFVTRTGPNSNFTPGQKVLAFSPHAFASHITVPSEAVAAIPQDLDLASAAAIPVIFVTAEYALNDLARLSPGEWCLIHGGAGGVGLAAIQVAKRAGARVIASAGSEKKRELLRAIGVDHVCDSRSLGFSDVVSDVTEGRGVDVVLNSLAGEAMERGIGSLAPFGRFVELGKRDFVANTAIGLRALKNNISYFAVDADQLLHHRPETVRKIMDRVVGAFASGDYHLPPVRRFSAGSVADAFRLMQRSGHIGKIVVSPPAKTGAKPPSTAAFDGAWLIAGGTRGFGLATAEWLADNGASKLWLVSKSGTVENPAQIGGFRDRGIDVKIVTADLTDGQAVSELFGQLQDEDIHLSGIVNAAAVFDDAMFADADEASLERVIEAKLVTAKHLDSASADMNLNHFWLYSSVAARFGNPGQSAYVAANLELEALAEDRIARGLPALAVAWGPIGDAGYLDRTVEVREFVELKLGKTLRAREALDALAQAIKKSPNQAALTIAPIEWNRLKSDVPIISEPLFECLDLDPEASGAETTLDIGALIEEQGEAKARKALLELLRREAAQIMRTGPAEIDVDRELVDLGFDSLMGMSLKLAMEERLQSAMPITSVADGMTLSKLAHAIVTSSQNGNGGSVTDSMADRHLTESDLPSDLKTMIADAASGQN